MKTVSEIYLHYSKPAPRYNSYPVLPYWSNTLSTAEWLNSCRQSLSKKDPSLGIYIHIPFCEQLCSFCACNTYITRDHVVEEFYLQTIHKEFALYLEALPDLRKSSLVYLYIGGGTPNFFSPQNLRRLLEPILSTFLKLQDHEFSVEMDVRHVLPQHLEVLYELGFRRLSLGIEDFDPTVQAIINRIQSPKQVRSVCDLARRIGYRSLHFDLIYGLPRQSPASIRASMQTLIYLRPDSLAYYGYTHVPQGQSAQRLFGQDDLPQGMARLELYQIGRAIIEAAGYQELGMDHFALEHDLLWKTREDGNLERNFMGYIRHKADLLLGLGASAISESTDCYHQNEKILKKYQKQIHRGSFCTLKGHKLSEEDLRRRKIIKALSTSWRARLPEDIFQEIQPRLAPLLTIEENKYAERNGLDLKILPAGRPLLRNICMTIDAYLEHRPA